MNGTTFREEVRDWLQDNYPKDASQADPNSDIAKEWLAKLIEKGWTAPHWPREYGGAGLDTRHHRSADEYHLQAHAGIAGLGRGQCRDHEHYENCQPEL